MAKDRFKDLTDKQKQFCKEYVTDWNATRAAIASGYSENTAQVIGSENLSKPIIKEYIEYIQEDLLKLCGISVLGNINVLKEILENKESRETDRIKALEVVNKMLGLNAPEKREVTNKIDLTAEEKEARIQELNKKLKD